MQLIQKKGTQNRLQTRWDSQIPPDSLGVNPKNIFSKNFEAKVYNSSIKSFCNKNSFTESSKLIIRTIREYWNEDFFIVFVSCKLDVLTLYVTIREVTTNALLVDKIKKIRFSSLN